MKKIKQKIKVLTSTAIGCVGFVIVLFVLIAGVNIARAAWDEPQAAAPEGNIFAPLHIGSDKQAKKGRLLLDPLYNPNDPMPTINYPLEVRGAKDVYINDLMIETEGSLTVDTDTLYVDGTSDYVGIGTIAPTSKLDIAGGQVSIGKSGEGVTGTGLMGSSSNALGYGIFGQTLGDAQASVYGSSILYPGIYGLNTSTSAGIRADSITGSALVGEIFSPYESGGVIKSGIYGRARGLGSWAGYFDNRVYSTQEIVGRKFIPNELQFSQVPYTAGWEIRPLPHTVVTEPGRVAFDGQNIWASERALPFIYIIDAETGYLVRELSLDTGNGELKGGIGRIIYAGGYMWIASTWDQIGDGCGYRRELVIKVDPSNYDKTYYPIGPCHGSHGAAVDIVYDDQTAGGPYIWTVSQFDNANDYAIGRLEISNGIFMDPVKVSGQCESYPTPTSPKEVGAPSAITMQAGSDNLWITFKGFPSTGEGIARVKATDLSNSAVYCIGPGRAPDDIVYDPVNDLMWVGNGPTWQWGFTYNGLTAVDPDTGAFVVEYNNIEVGSKKVESTNPVNKMLFDNQTAGGPYIWAGTIFRLNRYKIDEIDNPTISYVTLPRGNNDIIDDWITSGGPYLWLPSASGASVSRFAIATDELTSFIPKGAPINDMVFDGSSVWVTNEYDFSVSKFQASDGKKIGDFSTGYRPDEIIFDGQSIWTINNYEEVGIVGEPRHLTQLRASDGKKIGDYQRINREGADDAVFDGKNMWWSRSGNNWLQKILLDTCVDADGSGPNNGSCPNQFGYGSNKPDLYDPDGAELRPNQMVFDGDAIWATRHYKDQFGNEILGNKIAKITDLDNDPPTVKASLTIPGVSADKFELYYPNITNIEFDGTYIWIGTAYTDSKGNSVYKIDPRGINAGDSFSGVCSHDPGVYCNANFHCGGAACEALVVAEFPIYHESGRCGVDSGEYTGAYCMSDLDCATGEMCWGKQNQPHLWSQVASLTFDGTYMWVTNGTATDNLLSHECDDGEDNDGDGDTDDDDSDCYYHMYHDSYEMDRHEADTGVECADSIDNDGNGLCDYDGAAGQPGCSGRPDPGCTSDTDKSESTIRNASHLTRIMAATDQLIDSLHVGKKYCTPDYSVFDGTHLWLGAHTGCYLGQVLAQYYTGGGFGLTNLSGSVGLLPGIDVNNPETGGLAVAGSVSFGANLSVLGDLVVSFNDWGGVDSLKDFNTGCDNGEFAKGVDITAGLQCRGL